MMKKTDIKILCTTVFLFFFISVSSFAEIPVMEQAGNYEANIPVRIVKKFPLPEGYHEGLFCGSFIQEKHPGRHIWVANGKGGNIWLVDMASGTVISKIKPVGNFTEGIIPAGDGAFWLTDWEDKKLYRVRTGENGMTSEYEISLAPAHPTGVVRAGENFYMITWTRGMGTKYHLIKFDREGHVLQKIQIKRIHEPAHLAWDGRHLWITSWYNQLVYKVDINTFRILGSFKSPAQKTTGIAWDGKCFWITGTYAGLYCMEVAGKTDSE